MFKVESAADLFLPFHNFFPGWRQVVIQIIVVFEKEITEKIKWAKSENENH